MNKRITGWTSCDGEWTITKEKVGWSLARLSNGYFETFSRPWDAFAKLPESVSRYGTGPDDLSETEPERIVVTEEMIAAARAAHGGTSDEWIPRVYRAMARIAPKDNGWEPTLHSADFVNRLADARDAMEVERDAALDVVKDLEFDHRALLITLNELFAAHEALLQRLADLEPKPEVKPDPFRPHADDRRKIGWVS